MDYQRLIDWADDRIVEDSRKVILVFLVLTLVFGAGLGSIGTSSGTASFTTGVPAEEAFTDVNEKFSPTFGVDTGSTQLIQRGENVLSRESLLRMLRSQERVSDHPELRVVSTSSAASVVATQLDPSASTPEERVDAVEHATAGEIDAAVRAAADRGGFTSLLSSDFNAGSAAASATIGVVTHEVPAGISQSAGQGGSSPLTAIQQRVDHSITPVSDGSITVFGSGIVSAEFSSVVGDSLLIVVPAALIFIVLFLTIAYRDLIDLLLGMTSLFMAIVWTFGFTGLVGIPFSQVLISVPPLLLAVGIDFGIHAVNRYREEQAAGASPSDGMRTATDQLLVAFFIVTGTTTIGFLANLTSALPPLREFGIVAGVGIVFTFLVFGIFLPAAKVEIDRLRERYPIPTFSTSPLGSEGSALSSVLRVGVVIGERAPVVFLLTVLAVSAGAGVYATGVDDSFTQEDFLPPEDNPDFLMQLPEPFKPGDYTATETLNYLEDTFDQTQSSQAIVYLEGSLQRDTALEEIHRAGDDPPDSFVRTDGRAESTSIVTVIDDLAARDPEFRALVDRNDRNDNGVPDDDLRAIYDYLLDSSSRDRALDYMTEDRRAAQVVYTTTADAEQSAVTDDAQVVADRFRMDAIATGQTIVFQAVSDVIFESATVSLVVALGGAAVFLVILYRVLEGYGTLGLVNLVPVAITVVAIVASMRLFGISFNAFNASLLAITIGLGVDYSVHVTHRFADERKAYDLSTALDRTVRGTGGALLGSMLTTVFGIGVLALAVFPAIGQFGILTGLTVLYAFLASILVLPSTLVVWDALINDTRPSGLLGLVPRRGRTRPADDD